MSAINTINTAMREGCIYRVCDLAVMTQIDADTVRQVLKLMVKGGGSRGITRRRVQAQEAVQDPSAAIAVR